LIFSIIVLVDLLSCSFCQSNLHSYCYSCYSSSYVSYCW